MADPIVTPQELLGKLLAGQEVDVLREAAVKLLRELMEIEVTGKTGAARGERSPDRLCLRNGYRERRLDTRVGTLALPIPKLWEARTQPRGARPPRPVRLPPLSVRLWHDTPLSAPDSQPPLRGREAPRTAPGASAAPQPPHAPHPID